MLDGCFLIFFVVYCALWERKTNFRYDMNKYMNVSRAVKKHALLVCGFAQPLVCCFVIWSTVFIIFHLNSHTRALPGSS